MNRPVYSKSGERPSRQYIGMGDFVVSDEEEAIRVHVDKEKDFSISSDVKSDTPIHEYTDQEYDRDSFKYIQAFKEDNTIRVVKRVRINDSIKNFEIAIGNDNYLFWAQKYNEKFGLGEATLTKRRGRPKKDSVLNLLNACKKDSDK
ncbi:hypothetical protein SS50377_25484 [Spironucleus salmonicida]|uniref:Uncharacterized protein n=1 Tax=Spironucleus salmonicida TaxID=348837 RepID=V6LKD9_9EUKA|nr:hypothetical protein SS50377_25484 [Spironucleus salmonicida]|eukprot:EST45032.1 Hypothetical protein SS50377_15051 [Spironucleus salmonicida]